MTFRFVVSSVVRGTRVGDVSGFVRVVEGESGRVLFTGHVPETVERAHDPNPRGGTRGARGVAVHDDRLIIANADRVFVLDAAWRVQAELSHPLVGRVHDVLAEDDGVWIASTAADLLVKLDWEGRLVADWEWRRDAELVAALGFRRMRPVDRSLDYRDAVVQHTGVRNVVHLNSIGRGPDHLLVSLGRVLSPQTFRRQWAAGAAGRVAARVRRAGAPRSEQNTSGPSVPASRLPGSCSAVVSLGTDGRGRLLRRDGGTELPNHNVAWWRDRLVWCDSNATRISMSLPGGAGLERAIALPGDPGFVRGLAAVGDTTVLVGNQSPFAVYLVDLEQGTILRRYDLPGPPAESVYAIALLPDVIGTPATADWVGTGPA